MYGLSGEHILIVVIILLIFGPRRLPGLGHSIGRTMKSFRDGLNGITDPEPAKKPALLEPKAGSEGNPASAEAVQKEKQTEKA